MSEVVREDDLDDAAYQRREVYAHYGAAMLFAQVLEQGIVNALTFAQVATHEAGTQEMFQAELEVNSAVTMGRLLRRVQPFLGDDSALGEALTVALHSRNDFAHRFWVRHDRNFLSFTGREVMLAECMDAQALFQDVDQRLNPVLERYLRSLGITPEMQAATAAGEFDRMYKEAVSSDEASPDPSS